MNGRTVILACLLGAAWASGSQGLSPARPGSAATRIVASHATCVLTDSGLAKCWGDNRDGLLGSGDSLDRGGVPAGSEGFKAVSVPEGRRILSLSISDHACALLDDSSVVCWGDGTWGALGIHPGAKDRKGRFVAGRRAGELGDSLRRADLGAGRKALAVAAGGGFTCAILDDRSVACWGDNREGELGVAELVNTATGRAPGDPLGKVRLPKGRKASAIAAGTSFACALLDDGTVVCWGSNTSGQCGLRDPGARPHRPGDVAKIPIGKAKAVAIGAGSEHACALLTNGGLACWGDDTYGQLGRGDAINDCHRRNLEGPFAKKCRIKPEQVAFPAGWNTSSFSLGQTHSCAVSARGDVACWGEDSDGRLGAGGGSPDTCAAEPDKGVPCRRRPSTLAVDASSGSKVAAVAAGAFHTCALYRDASVRCWGSGDRGILGYGDRVDRNRPPTESVRY